jgi:glyoxylase-like metal-dependent hydrolase (beta-lactamase superfamily II)
LWVAVLGACTPTDHPISRATMGVSRSSTEMLSVLSEPGPVLVETVLAADWKVDLSGLLNLDSEAAQAAGLQDREEPIQIYFHVLTHPARGTFLIDSGVEAALRDAPDQAALSGLAAWAFHADWLKVRAPLREWLSAHQVQPTGVLLTHLHADHLLGLPELDADTPLYIGPGEAEGRSLTNVFVRPTMTRLLAGHEPFRELSFEHDSGGRFRGVLDLFGDRSVWVLHVPGHTPGSLAFVVRTPTGPVLFTGDTCHTAWGWNHDVEPGSFTQDQEANAQSLAALRKLARENPNLEVRLGHQPL